MVLVSGQAGDTAGRQCRIGSSFVSVDDLKQLDEILGEYGQVIYTTKFGDQFFKKTGVKDLIKVMTSTSRVKTLTVSMESSGRRVLMELDESGDRPNGMEIEGLDADWVSGRFKRLTEFFKARRTHAHVVHNLIFQCALVASVFIGMLLLYSHLIGLYGYMYRVPWWCWSLLQLLTVASLPLAILLAAMLPRWIPYANLQIGGLRKDRLASRRGVVEGIISGLLVYILLALSSLVWRLMFA